MTRITIPIVNVVEDYSFISEMGFEDDDYDRCVAYIRGELADEAPAARPRKLSDAEVDEILGDEDDEGDESEDFQEHRRNCIACTRDYPSTESDEGGEGDEGDQAEFCEVGEHYTTKEMMWPNFADCFDCASAKEYAEQRGISVELAEEIADGNDAEICLFIRCPNGNTLALYVSRCDEFTEVKELIFDKTRIHPEMQRLIFHGKQLDNNRTVDYYGIKNEDTLHLDYTLRGGMEQQQMPPLSVEHGDFPTHPPSRRCSQEVPSPQVWCARESLHSSTPAERRQCRQEAPPP